MTKSNRNAYRIPGSRLEHLDTIIKVLERSPTGLSANQARDLAESLKRFRDSMEFEAQPEVPE